MEPGRREVGEFRDPTPASEPDTRGPDPVVQGTSRVLWQPTMLETISKGFRNAKARFTGKTELTADVIDEALADVRMSLLEADVGFGVVKSFLARVKEKALGEEIQLAAK